MNVLCYLFLVIKPCISLASSVPFPPHMCSDSATVYLHLRERCWKRRIRLCHSSFHSMTIERRLAVSPGWFPSFSLPKIKYSLQQEQTLIKIMFSYNV